MRIAAEIAPTVEMVAADEAKKVETAAIVATFLLLLSDRSSKSPVHILERSSVLLVDTSTISKDNLMSEFR